jgi:predicted DNA-binding transcriptional regulator AlpA
MSHARRLPAPSSESPWRNGDNFVAAPAPYPSRRSLAQALDMAESAVDEMVKRGILPPPIKLSTGCVRWCWADVENALASLKDGAKGTAADALADPYIRGAQNVSRFSKSRCGTP